MNGSITIGAQNHSVNHINVLRLNYPIKIIHTQYYVYYIVGNLCGGVET